MNELRRVFREYKETDERVVEFKSVADMNDPLQSILSPSQNNDVTYVESVAAIISKATNAIVEVHRRNKEIENSASKLIAQLKKEASEAKNSAEKLHEEIDALKKANEGISAEAKSRARELESAIRTQCVALESMTQERDQAVRWMENFRSQVTNLLADAPRTARPNR
jgi:archaellum component FlaC